MTSNDNATSGGLLVVLGIVVALGGVYVYKNYISTPSPSITVTLPKIEK